MAQGYSYTYNKIKLESNFQKNLQNWGVKFSVGLGWLRVVAQGYSYSYINIKLVSSFQKNLKIIGMRLGWSLDGCDRWRKITIAVTTKLSWATILK